MRADEVVIGQTVRIVRTHSIGTILRWEREASTGRPRRSRNDVVVLLSPNAPALWMLYDQSKYTSTYPVKALRPAGSRNPMPEVLGTGCGAVAVQGPAYRTTRLRKTTTTATGLHAELVRRALEVRGSLPSMFDPSVTIHDSGRRLTVSMSAQLATAVLHSLRAEAPSLSSLVREAERGIDAAVMFLQGKLAVAFPAWTVKCGDMAGTPIAVTMFKAPRQVEGVQDDALPTVVEIRWLGGQWSSSRGCSWKLSGDDLLTVAEAGTYEKAVRAC